MNSEGGEIASPQLAGQLPQYSCGIPISSVRSGAVSPQEYLDDKSGCVPAVAAELASGRLKGILFAPTDLEIARITREQTSLGIKNKNELETRVKLGIKYYHHKLNVTDPEFGAKALSTIMPTSIDLIGKGIAAYIIVLPEFFNSKFLITDGDAESALRHDLKHAQDYFRPIQFGKNTISGKDILSGKITLKFYQHVQELRACYKQLYDLFEELTKKNTISMSNDYLGWVAASYSRYLEYVQRGPKTEFDRTISQLQLNDAKGITSTITDSGVSLAFNLFGVRQDIVLKYQ